MLLVAVFVAFSNHAIASDIFVGKFASLPEKMPFAEANELEIYIVPKGNKYIVAEFVKGTFRVDYLAKQCDSKHDLMMPSLASGEAYGLCTFESAFVTFVYSQNGIDGRDPRIISLKDRNGESIFEASYLKEQYFKPGFLAFRKVDSFKYAPNDPIQLLNHETPEFTALCRDAGVKLFQKPAAPVRSIAYDFDPRRITEWLIASRIAVDEDGRIQSFGGFPEPKSADAGKTASFDFTERRAHDHSGGATINPSAPYYHFPHLNTLQPYYGVENLSADVVAFLDVDKPDEFRKAPIRQGTIRHQITLTDRRSGAILGVQVFVIDRLNNRACGVNVDNAISPSAFVFDAINR